VHLIASRSTFISSRRHDASGHAGRLFDRLKERYGGANVFIDVAGIGAGADFIEAIESRVAACARCANLN
jgi:hypothetical protein